MTNKFKLGSCAAVAKCLLVLFALTHQVSAQTTAAPRIEDIPMRPLVRDQIENSEWFVQRFGLSWIELENSYSLGEVDAFLSRWRQTFPNDPEAWISSANWNARNSQQTMIFQADPQPGFFVTEGAMDDGTVGMRRVDGQEGAQSSFVTEGQFTDTERYNAAVAFFEVGMKKFPHRVDLYEIYAGFHIYFGNYDSLLEILGDVPDSIRSAKAPLEGTNYQPVQYSKDQVISRIFHSAHLELMKKGELQSTEVMLASAQLMTRAIPNDPIAWNDLVSVQYTLGNKQGAYSAAERAYALAPDDEVIVLNLATLSLDLGRRDRAIELNRWLLTNARDPNIFERAQAELELMGVALE